MTFAEKMILLCPRHSHKGGGRRGFRCICKELNEAFAMGYRSVRRRRRWASS